MTYSKRDTIKAALFIAVIGVLVYFSGLSGQFLNDDADQIINNTPLHSIANIGQFFSHSTFYNDQWISGLFYRPLMTTTFSLVYSVFGANPFWFHLLQLLLHLLCSFLLFLVLRYFLRPVTSLVLALVFLVHPINSQDVFSIASMQEPLFFLFGILGFWTLLRFYYSSAKWLILTATLFLLSLLSKETGILFVVMALVYAFMHDKDRRTRFYPLLVSSTVAVAIYLILRLHAVGPMLTLHVAPIDSLDLVGRLMNIPAILMFYVTKFVFPMSLAHYYYWVHPSFTLAHFLWPLIVDLAIGVLLIIIGRVVRRKAADRRYFQLYIFFALWLLAGLMMTLQILPLDETASETWFYFPIVGALGMIGVLVEAVPVRLDRRWVITGVAVLITTLGLRTAMRGLDFSDQTTLAQHDIVVSKEDYNSDRQIAFYLNSQGRPVEAKVYAEQAVEIQPTPANYLVLGRVLASLGQYSQARTALISGLKFSPNIALYIDLAQVDIRDNDITAAARILEEAIVKHPQSVEPWFDLAVVENMQKNNADAKVAISRAAELGSIDQGVYDKIMNDEPITVNFTFQ